MKKCIKFLIKFSLILWGFTTISCYTQKIELNEDKRSGKMTIEYYLNNDYFQLISIVASNFQYDDENYIDTIILINEAKFRENFKKYEGINLDFISIKKIREGEYTGKIVISFKDFEQALLLLPKSIAGLEIKKAKEEITINQIIQLSKMDPENIFIDFIEQLKEDDKEFYNLLTEKAVFNFEILTKTPIKKTEGIKLEKNNKATYSFNIKNLLENKDNPLKFSITF